MFRRQIDQNSQEIARAKIDIRYTGIYWFCKFLLIAY